MRVYLEEETEVDHRPPRSRPLHLLRKAPATNGPTQANGGQQGQGGFEIGLDSGLAKIAPLDNAEYLQIIPEQVELFSRQCQ